MTEKVKIRLDKQLIKEFEELAAEQNLDRSKNPKIRDWRNFIRTSRGTGPRARCPTLPNFIDRVDRFQGHEADIVFLSFVQNYKKGFLDCVNRLNVGGLG